VRRATQARYVLGVSPRMEPTIASTAAAAWLEGCGLDPDGLRHWWVEITLTCEHSLQSQLHLNIYPTEWGFTFRHAQKVSSIRITDQLHVEKADEHDLPAEAVELARFTSQLVVLEDRHRLSFRRHCAAVRSNIRRATPIVRAWLTLP
jgi:hypothetical protein